MFNKNPAGAISRGDKAWSAEANGFDDSRMTRDRSAYDEAFHPFEERGWEELRSLKEGVIRRAKDARQIVGGLPIDREAEGGDALEVRLNHGLAGIFDAIAAFVDVAIVGLSIGEHEEEAMARGLAHQRSRGVADGGASARIMLGLKRADTERDLSATQSRRM